ncbi:hypothetical protein L226DRAFT_150075 [Lentinus tigrinus ALCF2SS1-7]|uniref:Uncharacterized protein n=1 Tax=Lentinus tigrinus ALCF2SS1-6 TaxID=1328759 RepID=A0A5C2RW50_9APHY|nr:hypothetical protein L227DRAFT_302921 [Lentinus tigrinus ALCF2SS1-6]RPD72587.1 hypothetical protein L226DRAFT_150075 [Lentinus tigrinus ALCF2SS1-7]
MWWAGEKACTWVLEPDDERLVECIRPQQTAPPGLTSSSIMKTLFVLASLALSALAQQALIISPTNGSTITAGSTLVVDVHQDESATDDVQVAVVLGLAPCLTGPCGTPGEPGVGTILFKGEFNPQRDPSAPEKGLHQTFTVQVPQFSDQGDNILSLTHLQMVGAVKEASLQTNGIVVNVA